MDFDFDVVVDAPDAVEPEAEPEQAPEAVEASEAIATAAEPEADVDATAMPFEAPLAEFVWPEPVAPGLASEEPASPEPETPEPGTPEVFGAEFDLDADFGPEPGQSDPEIEDAPPEHAPATSDVSDALGALIVDPSTRERPPDPQ